MTAGDEVARTGAAERRGASTPARVAWRLLAAAAGEPGPLDGPTNMAVDRALLESVAAGAAPVLRLYGWDPPTLSFGRNQPAAGCYDEAAARARGIAFVRRPTGGQAVLHADELTYAVVAPVAAIGKPREAYRRINRALVGALRRLGLEASLAVGARPGAGDRSWLAACFREPAAGEVVVSGRKLVGSAQRCEGRVVLQHGSILVSGTQAAAEELLLDGSGAGPSADAGWTTLEAELGRRPSWSELTAAVSAGFAESIGTALAPARLSVEETTRVKDLRVTFASPDWTWRR